MANQYDVRNAIVQAGHRTPINTNQMNSAVEQAYMRKMAQNDINKLNNKFFGHNYSALNQPSGYSALGSQMDAQNQFGMANKNIQPRGYSSLGQQMNAMNLPMPTGQAKKRTGAVDTPPNWKDNLLNYIVSPKGKGMAQGLLEASGYSEVPVTFGQALSMGMQRGNEAETAAAASQLAKDKFAYQQKQDESLNWLKLKEILSKDSRTNIEKRMSAMFPNLVPGSPEYAEQAMKLLKAGGMNLDLGVQTAWGALETGSSNILTGYQKNTEKITTTQIRR